MKNHMTSRDYELISAYLDNQLGRKERALFEARLKTDAEMRKELQEISKTRLLVRRLPRLRARRNYFVKAEAARARPMLRMAPVFGIVSAVASVLLALVIFGNSFFSSSSQVAMAPMAPNTNAPLSVQPEVERSVTSPVSTTVATPVIMLGAPILATPTLNISAVGIGQTEIATPTTIYLYAYPPTSTPESGISIYGQETNIARLPCEEYYRTGKYPTPSDLYTCPTPTSTISANQQTILSSFTPTPSETPTPSPTTSPTPSASPTPTPSASPTPTPTNAPTSVEKLVPPSGEVSSTEVTLSDQSLGAGNPAVANQEPTVTSSAPNVSFLNYIVLTVEISLAAVAIIAGITAIVLRVRAR
jgi:hypothetical protein